jgi:Helix-turn-helix domain
MGAATSYVVDYPSSTIWNSRRQAATLPAVPSPKPRTRERAALGRAIRGLRAENALSREAVEAAGGLGQNALYRIEGGLVSPSFDSLVGVAQGLGVSLRDLIDAYERQLAKAPR